MPFRVVGKIWARPLDLWALPPTFPKRATMLYIPGPAEEHTHGLWAPVSCKSHGNRLPTCDDGRVVWHEPRYVRDAVAYFGLLCRYKSVRDENETTRPLLGPPLSCL